MPGKFGLSVSEYNVMSIIWKENNELLFKDIVKKVAEHGYTWAPQTIQTFIDHLVNKGALSFRWQGHKKSYFPSSTQNEYAAKWMKKVFEENFDNMDDFVLSLNNLTGQLTVDQIKELESIWNE